MFCKTCGRTCPSCGTAPVFEARSNELNHLMKTPAHSPAAEVEAAYQQGYENGYAEGQSAIENKAEAIVPSPPQDTKRPAVLTVAVVCVVLFVVILVSWRIGRNNGFVAGKQAGYELGYNAGNTHGFDEGFTAGQQVGIEVQKESYLAGYEAGILAAVTSTPAPTTDNMTPEDEAPTDERVPLGYASQGEDVQKLQERLFELGYYSGLIDGQFGNKTKEAVLHFQQKNNIFIDGVAGSETIEILFSEEAIAANEVMTAQPAKSEER